MKIGLVSCLMKDNHIEHQISQIEYYVSAHAYLDLVCFGESFLQGFEGLTWDYDIDIKRATSPHSSEINRIQNIANKYNTGISFGFIEKIKDSIYSSNMVIDNNGIIVDVFQRVSPGWKGRLANSKYKEGKAFHTFDFMGKKLCVAICGDVWYDIYLDELKSKTIDALLWPLYVDYSIEQWKTEINEYANRVKDLASPTLMINSFVEDSNRANGGCYVFYHSKVLKSLEMGNIGILEFNL